MKQTRRGALIGYGFIAENGHLPVYLERARRPGDFQISAIADVTPARRESAQRAAPDARIYESYRDLLQAEASQLDFVDITTPPSCHAEIARAALDRGLHVLCEKPIAMSFDEAREMARSQLPARARHQGSSCSDQPGNHRRRAPSDASDLSHDTRTWDSRLAPRLAARSEVRGRRHRHGSR